MPATVVVVSATFALNAPGPDQLYVTPDVVEPPFKIALVELQLII